MATQIVQIDRYRFICGLFWQSLSRRHELRAEALELAARLNFDAMVLRIDRSFAGAGFASTREGAQLGLPSLGALVSKTIASEGAFYDGRQQPAPNWLGAFSLPDGRWAYFAVRDGAFLPNGDWVGTSEEVFERLHSDYSLGGWNVVIGDSRIEAQGFHNFYARRIEDMIPRRGGRPHVPRWLNLARVDKRPRLSRIALVAAAVAVVGVGISAGLVYRQRKLEQARELAFARARAQLQLQQTVRAPTEPAHPWAAVPLPSTFVQGCLGRFDKIAPGGWQLDEFACRPANVSYSWSRSDSNVALLIAAEPHAVVDNGGEHATLVEPVALPAGGDEAIDGIHGVRIRMLSAFQLLGVSLNFAPQRSAVREESLATKTLGTLGAKRDAPPPPPWQTWRISAKLGDLSPTSVLRYLDQPGVRIDKVLYTSGEWSIEGVMYEK
jgi:hypothetical protein